MSDLLKVVSHDKPPTKSFLKHQTVLVYEKNQKTNCSMSSHYYTFYVRSLTLHKHTFNTNDTKCKKRTCVVPINLSALSTTYLLCQTQFQEVNHGIKIISTIHKIFKIFRVTPHNIFQPSYQTWDLTIETFS